MHSECSLGYLDMFDFQDRLCCGAQPDYDSGEEVEDKDAANLSHVAQAAYEVLRTKHNRFHHQLWNVTHGTVIDKLQYTPMDSFPRSTDPPEGHDDWFPEKMYDMICRTEVWCDIMSLGPPDGLFLDKFKEALKVLAEKAKDRGERGKITVRMMFGNIVGMPVNCTVVIRKLTEYLPKDPNIQLWVGAWRKGVSWNHAKIIAVDGQYLHTGGHNLWDYHYLKHNPVHDLSLELAGIITNDAHLYANEQWAFIESKQMTLFGGCVDKLPDALPMVLPTRVTISEFPEGKASIFPPRYVKRMVRPVANKALASEMMPMISIGRYGTILQHARPSDDAMVAMLDSAKTIIRLALQDLGPVCLPGTKIALPGTNWPKTYLSTMGRVIWEKGVDVEILLSNPGSIPGGLSATEANYGNGWSCVDVAAEIIKTIKKQFPEAEDDDLRKKVSENLRLCFIRTKGGNTWADGTSIGMHAKHFIVDDTCCYIGSQNLYVCDLAEWGIVIDNKDQVVKIMDEYWNPMWEASYTGEDCNVDEVMDGLEIDRDGQNPEDISEETRKKMDEALKINMGAPKDEDFYHKNDDDAPGSLHVGY